MVLNNLSGTFVLDYNEELTVEIASEILNYIKARYCQYYGELSFAAVDHIGFGAKDDKYISSLVYKCDANDSDWLREIMLAINVDNGTVYIDSNYSSVFSRFVNLYHLANF